MNEEIEKLNELIAGGVKTQQLGIKIIEKADLALESLEILESNIVPAVDQIHFI